MSNVQAAKLIIENIQLLEQAKIILEGEIAEKLLTSVDEVVKRYLEGFEGWGGNFNFYEKNDLKFAPENWQAKQETEFKHQNFYARYCLNCESSEIGGDYHEWWVSTFLKNDIDRIIFSIYPWYENYKEKVNKKKWNEFANEKNQLQPEIEQCGFKFNASNGSWYIVVDGIEPKTFIENYESDTLEDALIPITDALGKLEKAHPYFDKIVQAAIEKFGRIESEDAV
ncbi:hypothetical protein B9T24_02375 [Acinetobacter sp. ANC 4654]|uniref:hypothetical protein n=1 Tax=Acinetobacter sp. ANC 4654 TaxID=1977872 RepID=UPI000A34C1A9|nr:hypothetical protein [Acinetobacter sp. ANC 4654]OTG98219.1 hypothetical protein B9T24_02375 [Acinetobacter sp. ANC 4654]